MLGRATVTGVLLFALFSSACDSGSSTQVPPMPPSGDATDVGSNEDVGAEDGPDPTVVERNGHLKVTDGQLVNEAGEPIQLKGVSSMWLNWESQAYAEDARALRWMRNNWKLTVIRAAMGVEPAGAYLELPEIAKKQVYDVVDHAIDAGVYVIVDFHAHKAHEHTDDAVAFFSEIAAKYSGSPNVIYEPFNEPVGIGWADLKKYHEKVVAAIREQDRGSADRARHAQLLPRRRPRRDRPGYAGLQPSVHAALLCVHAQSLAASQG